MANLEDEVRDLKKKNSELVQEVQYWKVTAANREKEKLELMKELNDIRLKWSRLRSGGIAEALKLDAALQAASKEALTLLVQASGAVARGIDLSQQHLRNRQELDLASPRWSNLSGTPTNDSKVNKVLPLLIGGQSIQPVVALRRTMLNSSARSRSPNHNIGVTERAVPMHMLQDVYIPLTRIDLAELQGNVESDVENSTDDLGLQDSNEQIMEESQNISEDMDESRRLDDVKEEVEPEDEEETPSRSRIENPLEGPSWLLDEPQSVNVQRSTGRKLEPDSTTVCDQPSDDAEKENEPLSVTLAFTPTVRRRKRASSPPAPLSPLARSPRQRHKRVTNSNRVLKVVVAKMRLSNETEGSPPKMAKLISSPRNIDTPHRRSTIDSPLDSPRSALASPRRSSEDTQRDSNRPTPNRPARFDAPSPNGSTDARLVVLETSDSVKQSVAQRSLERNVTQWKRAQFHDSDSDDSDEANTSTDSNARERLSVYERISKRRNTQQGRSCRERHNSNSERHNRNVSKSNMNESNVEHDYVRNVNECHDTQRVVSRNERDVSEENDRNVGDQNVRNVGNQNVNERHDSAKGDVNSFVSGRRGINRVTERIGSGSHDNNVSERNVSERNVSDTQDVNVTERKISDRNVAERTGSNRHARNITERNVSDGHGNVSDRNVNVSERSVSRQIHDVDSDTSSSDFDAGRGRSRRNKKKVTYTEVPLNRKLRR